ncbi:MAG TPA: FAD-dependent oxidoreductase [Microbacterium sp.]|nr:FAD-dependent oxidoreductase [Microbacterium sp.]
MNDRHIVIIGAGIVGVSIADELTARGISRVTVIDKGRAPAFGGSTSHAPGMVFQLHQNPTMSQFAQHTVDLLSDLADADGPVWTRTGSLELADSDEWESILRRRAQIGRDAGLDIQILTPTECVQHQPILDTDAFRVGIHDPGDGVVHVIRAAAERLRRAVARGAQLRDETEVTGFEIVDERIVGVRVGDEIIPADDVIVAAGIWGEVLSEMAGEHVPVMPFVAPGGFTGPLASLADATADARGPIIRFADAALTMRERRDSLEFGYSQHAPTPVDPRTLLSFDEAEEMPSILEFHPEIVDAGWPKVNRLVPDTRGTAYARGQHGVMATTPDNLPLLGPSSAVGGLWYAEQIWVTHSAGAALAVAEWVADGESTTFDVSEMHADRFSGISAEELYQRNLDSIDLFGLQRKVVEV